MPPPRPAARWLPRILAAAVVALSIVSAHRQFVRPDDLPTGDAGYYTLQAMALGERAAAGDLAGVAAIVLRPALHPAGHPAALAGWMAIAGDRQAAARAYGVAAFVVAMVLLLWVARGCDPRDGERAGLAAVTLTALAVFQRTHLFTAMTEPTALVVWLAALGVAIRLHGDPRHGARLAVGIAVLAAGLVRYNLAPMLLVPLALHHLAEHRGRGRAALDPRLLWWLAPTALVFGVWALAEPELPGAVRLFLVNRDALEPRSFGQQLVWVPQTLATRYTASWWLAIPLFAGVVAGGIASARRLVAGAADEGAAPPAVRTSPGLRLLQWTLLVAVVALTLHPLKIGRSLLVVAPLVWLCALLPFAGWRGPAGSGWRTWARRAAPWLAVALLGVYAYGAIARAPRLLPTLDEDYYPDPALGELLDVVAPHAEHSRWLLIRGWGFGDHVFPLGLHERGVDAQVIQRWDPDVLLASADDVGAAERGAVAAYVLVEAPGARAKRDEGAVDALRRRLDAAGIPRVAAQRTAHGWAVEVYQQRRRSLPADGWEATLAADELGSEDEVFRPTAGEGDAEEAIEPARVSPPPPGTAPEREPRRPRGGRADR